MIALSRQSRGFRAFVAAALATAGLAACVTINVYFPEAAIRDLSRQIEEEVQKKAAEQKETGAGASETAPQGGSGGAEPSAAERSSRLTLLDLLTGTTPALADDVPSPEVTSPAIRKIIESRAARAAALNAHKAAGVIGESNQALLEIRNLEALGDLKARAEVQRLVKAENADREELFKEIAAAENVDLAQLPRIRETYAATLREKARPGDLIQMQDGTWKKK